MKTSRVKGALIIFTHIRKLKLKTKEGQLCFLVVLLPLHLSHYF